MTDPRASTALHHLPLDVDDSPPGRWRWAVLQPEPRTGRVRLPAPAVVVLGDTQAVWARVNHEVLVLSTQARRGRRVGVDQRGRLYLPVWLRRPTVLVATDLHEGLVLVADAALLDPVGDRLLIEVLR